MSFDKKEDISKPATVELSDDALEGVSGGTTLNYDPDYEPPENLKIEVMVPSSSALIDTPTPRPPLPSNLEEAISHIAGTQSRPMEKPPKITIGK